MIAFWEIRFKIGIRFSQLFHYPKQRDKLCLVFALLQFRFGPLFHVPKILVVMLSGGGC